jgi:hypothetical protein
MSRVNLSYIEHKKEQSFVVYRVYSVSIDKLKLNAKFSLIYKGDGI